jgi:hypothetical protein
MIDPQARPAAYIKLLALVVVLGLICALITFAFMAVVHQGTGLIWEQAALALGLDPRIFTILVCAIGGLLVGLLVKLFGDNLDILREHIADESVDLIYLDPSFNESAPYGAFDEVRILAIEGLLRGTESPRYPDLSRGGANFRKAKVEETQGGQQELL